MAGDWIKVQHCLVDDPAVDIMADLLKVSHDEVVGKLIKIWCWADRTTADGHVPSVTASTINGHADCAGFAEAMQNVTWLRVTSQGVTFVNYERHMGESAKKRAQAAHRQAKCRARRRHAGVTQGTLPEKRREEKSKRTPKPPTKVTLRVTSWQEVAATYGVPSMGERWEPVWAEWVKHRREIGKPLKDGQHLRRMVRELGEWGVDRAIAAIEHTVSKGWQGLREPTGDNQKGGTNGGRFRTSRDAENGLTFLGGRAKREG